MEAVLLRCPRCRSELRREVPPDREFVAVYGFCKNASDVRAAHDPVRMVEAVRIPLEELVSVG